ncbi:discoidin domain-containing protein [Paenibacillus farraposensis]|uniref:Discoidin domain-containing protein n=2 Tax=Paenibacillus farraposensis TaxID=2807095 RepID=A0ABW4DJ85_9BACL|nr:discoidin domain-containing protein [Paenibacillus farraposensis]
MSKKIISTILFFLLFSTVLLPSIIHASMLNKTVEGMLGFSPPEGTTVKASSEYTAQYAAKNSIDGSMENYWNAGTFKGNIELTFPNPVKFNFVHITTNSQPVRTVSYTIYGLTDGKWEPISGQITQALKSTFTTPPPIKVKEGIYEAIRIDGDGGESWLAIGEVTLGTFETINLTGQPQNASAKLNWNTIKEATNYKINYGTQPNKYTDSISVEKDAAGNYVIPNLTNGTTYYFQVVAIFNGVETVISNEASATPQGGGGQTDPEQPSGDRAILVVTMTTGLEKEFDLSMKEVNDFISWYEGKQAGSGSASYAINKHDNNKGPFSSRKDYMLYDRILTFEVSEYSK